MEEILFDKKEVKCDGEKNLLKIFAAIFRPELFLFYYLFCNE